MTERFLLDTNSFVTPYRQYYAFDLIPAYWKELSRSTHTGNLILLDMVKEEVNKGNDPLSQWLNEQSDFIICSHISPEIILKYQEILQYIQTCGLYKEQALERWSSADVADPWLIAAAAVNKYTLITAEVSSGGLSIKTPNKYAKIPDVANAFGVKTNDLYYMMRRLGIKI